MFPGFPEETVRFFLDLRFHNETSWFHAHREAYEAYVRKPFSQFIQAMTPTVMRIADDMETRPNKCLARINRDIRFTRDKSPYRDHVWISFRRPEEERGRFPSFFIEVGVEGVFYGMGAYAPERARMNALRRHLRLAPEEPEALLAELGERFTLYGETYKRLAVPEELPEALVPLYIRKSYYWERSLPFGRACSAALAAELAADLSRLKPLYDYMADCTPEEEDYL